MRVTKHKFKTEEVAMTFLSLEPTLIFIIAHMLRWCDQRSLPFVVTSAVREFETGQVSQTHPDGRAIDVSVRDWQADQIEAFGIFALDRVDIFQRQPDAEHADRNIDQEDPVP